MCIIEDGKDVKIILNCDLDYEKAITLMEEIGKIKSKMTIPYTDGVLLFYNKFSVLLTKDPKNIILGPQSIKKQLIKIKNKLEK